VDVLNVRPAGAAGVIPYESIAPPEDVIVYPVIALLTVLVSEELESVKAGAAKGAVVGVGGTYAGVVTGSETADIGDVPSAVVADTVKVYVVCA
jgi:hypothetical protein